MDGPDEPYRVHTSRKRSVPDTRARRVDGRPRHLVMTSEGPPPTPCDGSPGCGPRNSWHRRGWRAFARHDGGWVAQPAEASDRIASSMCEFGRDKPGHGSGGGHRRFQSYDEISTKLPSGSRQYTDVMSPSAPFRSTGPCRICTP